MDVEPIDLGKWKNARYRTVLQGGRWCLQYYSPLSGKWMPSNLRPGSIVDKGRVLGLWT